MGVIFKTEKRRVIPRMRSFEATLQTGELDLTSYGKENPQFILDTKTHLTEQVHAWKSNKDIVNASDLLTSAFVLGKENDFTEIAKYVYEHENASNQVKSVAEKVLKIIPQLKPEESDNILPSIPKNKYIGEIRRYKLILKKEPRHPIAWAELGRLYSLLNQLDKAKFHFDKSLWLEKNNRFIVRSASRFYNHFFEDSERSLSIVRNSSFLKGDPWLLAAEISYSNVLERRSKFIKTGSEFLAKNLAHYASISELASAIGTVEAYNDNKKKAKVLFNQSLVQPNDNTLAQAEWIMESVDGLFVEKSKLKDPFAYEANTVASYDSRHYDQAFKFALEWQNDEPYSTRPILSASYISGIFLEDIKKSVELLTHALDQNERDVKIKNNLVYFLTLDNNIAEAEKYFDSQLENIVHDNQISISKISLVATKGLLLYRQGHHDSGKLYYLSAIELANKMKNDYLQALAIANFLREELKISKEHTEDIRAYMKRLDKLREKTTEPDIQKLSREIELEYKKTRY